MANDPFRRQQEPEPPPQPPQAAAEAANACSFCSAPLKPGAGFCAQCGASQPKAEATAVTEIDSGPACRQCGNELRPGAMFCGRCGADQEPAAAAPPPSPEPTQASAIAAPATAPVAVASPDAPAAGALCYLDGKPVGSNGVTCPIDGLSYHRKEVQESGGCWRAGCPGLDSIGKKGGGGGVIFRLLGAAGTVAGIGAGAFFFLADDDDSTRVSGERTERADEGSADDAGDDDDDAVLSTLQETLDEGEDFSADYVLEVEDEPSASGDFSVYRLADSIRIDIIPDATDSGSTEILTDDAFYDCQVTIDGGSCEEEDPELPSGRSPSALMFALLTGAEDLEDVEDVDPADVMLADDCEAGVAGSCDSFLVAAAGPDGPARLGPPDLGSPEESCYRLAESDDEPEATFCIGADGVPTLIESETGGDPYRLELDEVSDNVEEDDFEPPYDFEGGDDDEDDDGDDDDDDADDEDGDGIPDDEDFCVDREETENGFQDGDGCPDDEDDVTGDDVDSDGVADESDFCINDPETENGFQDSDGCPDAPGSADGDGDGFADENDPCAFEAENLNGFQDGDGCPDIPPTGGGGDDDSDGIANSLDFCLATPENVNGFQDGDGCPDTAPPTTDNDTDDDGIVNASDFCPSQAENFNGFFDGDGCPDNPNADGDADGIIDSLDFCLFEAENYNGFEDGDGCPDVAQFYTGDIVPTRGDGALYLVGEAVDYCYSISPEAPFHARVFIDTASTSGYVLVQEFDDTGSGDCVRLGFVTSDDLGDDLCILMEFYVDGFFEDDDVACIGIGIA